MNFDIAELGVQEKYRLLNGGVTPRPIAWISTRSKEGVDNLAPYSFFTVASCNPPVLLYTQVSQRNGIDKDTLQNLKATGECVINIVNSHLLEKMNKTSASITIDESEFDFADVDKIASSTVAPFSVKASPIRYECTLRELITLGDLPAGGTLVLLDVKFVYVRDDLYSDEGINQVMLDSVGKMGGDGFSLTSAYVALERP
ncbi:flavin reductase family protein [Colwellia hornerae]|uniref:Flavin reductase family protein n=1 Tax=Colwellia hornerae TaxID=89402 RepID=A0A5C6QCQ2_9GAMM|nr:flavin reductase family protein [Colwellia hornerae]TWX55142.1 flavin reductase family protein [Colwellia hornerae]TWX61142.1 flavin reductase family protein [Colwellia hornerae]TWX66508.1 flavin reductase family protein [Colwellia hornerae]